MGWNYVKKDPENDPSLLINAIATKDEYEET